MSIFTQYIEYFRIKKRRKITLLITRVLTAILVSLNSEFTIMSCFFFFFFGLYFYLFVVVVVFVVAVVVVVVYACASFFKFKSLNHALFVNL